jgi:hypothetical protein
MYIRKKHLSRRTVLKGAGVAIGLPLLDAMVPASTALAQTAAAPKVRLGFVFVPHGVVFDSYAPKATGRDFELPVVLQPFGPSAERGREHGDLKNHITVISNLRNRPGESPDPHGIKAGTWLRCVAPANGPGPDDGTSIDQIAARAWGAETPFPSLELATAGGGTNNGAFASTIAFRTPDQPLPMEPNPRKLYYRLFGQGDTAEERAQIVEETGSLLDLVHDNAASLRAELGAADRRAMDEYLDSVREIELQVEKLQAQDFSGLDLPDAPVGIPGQFPAHVDLMFDLMALAYQANLTRVATFMVDREVSMRTYTHIGVSDAFHPLSHHQNDPAKLERLSRVQQWHMSTFARFVAKLANMPDGDGTMLDHVAILYGSGMGNSDLHDCNRVPAVIAGHAMGAIRGGQHIAAPADTPLANLMLTLLDRANVEADHFGDSTGMISEV